MDGAASYDDAELPKLANLALRAVPQQSHQEILDFLAVDVLFIATDLVKAELAQFWTADNL